MTGEDPLRWNNERNSADYPLTPFWIIMAAGAILGLAYLMVWGVHNNSIEAIGIGVVFTTFLFAFALVYLFVRTKAIVGIDTPVPSAFKTSAFWLINGMLLWSVAAQFGTVFGTDGQQKNMLLIQPYSIAIPELTPFWKSFVNIISAPISEECLFLIAMPLVMIYLLEKQFKIGRGYSLIITVVTTGVTFAYFHVGFQAVTLFLMAAFFFRLVMNMSYWGDANLQIFTRYDVAPEFVVGAHIANNIMTTNGYVGVLNIFLTNPLGIFFIGLFGIAAYYWVEVVAEKTGVMPAET